MKIVPPFYNIKTHPKLVLHTKLLNIFSQSLPSTAPTAFSLITKSKQAKKQSKLKRRLFKMNFLCLKLVWAEIVQDTKVLVQTIKDLLEVVDREGTHCIFIS